MKFTKSEAAKAANISRTTFYNKYLNTGEILQKVDEQGRTYIDSADILRVFGAIHPSAIDIETENKKNRDRTGNSNDATVNRNRLIIENDRLEVSLKAAQEQIDDLKEQLRKADIRESDLRQIITNLSQPR